MKRLLLLCLSLLVLSWCSGIKISDVVRCWDLVAYQFDWEIMYKDWDYIVMKWIMEETIYWNYSEKCNETMEFDDCYMTKKTTGERVFNIKDDWCFRPDNYQDLINRRKNKK